jgi:hypothetical protein
MSFLSVSCKKWLLIQLLLIIFLNSIPLNDVFRLFIFYKCLYIDFPSFVRLKPTAPHPWVLSVREGKLGLYCCEKDLLTQPPYVNFTLTLIKKKIKFPHI